MSLAHLEIRQKVITYAHKLQAERLVYSTAGNISVRVPGRDEALISATGVSLGDISASSSVSAAFSINFAGCPSTARFTLNMPWNSAVYDTGTLVSANQFQ